ncbi:MAG TPA: alanine racemase [Gemmatimonadaceae bacterium]|nr:alanine racemase [Gemmatimonadaceae bacterium]
MQPSLTRAWAEIDLGALRRNAAALARHAGVPLLPMVKADAYGLGVIEVVRALEVLSPWGYGVATVDEGALLRRAGIARPLVVFTPVLGDDVASMMRWHLTPALGSAREIDAWTRAGGGSWHLAIDTGMSRAGIRWDLARTLRALVERYPPQGAFTHFHSAECEDGSMQEQEQRFRAALAALPLEGALLHAENSAAIVRRARSPWDLVRPGIFLYGVGSGPGAKLTPEPVVHVRARVVDVRDVHDGETVSYGAAYRVQGERRIATLAIGYADGYARALGNHAHALLAGERVRVAGVVTMDMTMVDVTGHRCEPGDAVTLVGADGTEHLTLEDVCAAAALSPYEALTRLAGRLPRVYRDAEAVGGGTFSR